MMMRNITVSLLFLAIIVVYLPAGGNAAITCPKGFDLLGKRCYLALDLYASWPEAKELCKTLGAKLAVVSSLYEHTQIVALLNFLHGKFTNEVYWLDGSDMLVSKEWRWMGENGASTPIKTSFWAAGQPDYAVERCLEIRFDWGNKWNNAWCHWGKSVICEAKATATNKEKIDDSEQSP